MKSIIFVVLLFSQVVLADAQKTAVDTTQQAILAYPQVQQVKHTLETKLSQYSPFDRDTTVVLGVTVISLGSGSVNTKPIKNLKIKFTDGDVRPDMTYNLRNGEVRAYVNLKWSFP